MSAEAEKVTQQDQSTGPPVAAATSVAEIPAPVPPPKQEDPGADNPVEPAVGSGPAPTTNGGVEGVAREEPKPAPVDLAAFATEPAAVPDAPAAVEAKETTETTETTETAETKETNGAAKPAVAAVPEGATALKEPAPEIPSEKAEKPTEIAPTDQAAPATAGANGEPKPSEDTEMKDAAPPVTATAETVTEDITAAPVGVSDDTKSNKRKAETALGPDADADAEAGSGKKAKTSAVETGAEQTGRAAPTETNGGSAKAPPAKKGGRPRKQQQQQQQAKQAAPVGRTARKTRSQGPVEV